MGEYRLRGGANYTRVSQGARRGAVRYPLGRAMPLALVGLALLVAVSLGVPLGLVRLAAGTEDTADLVADAIAAADALVTN